MTEKRYTHNILGSVFKDGEVFALTEGECQAITLCIELNELDEVNEQLKNEIEKIAYANEDLLKEKRSWKKLSEEYAKLYEENEQLKSKNRGLQSELQIFKEDVTHSNLQINKLADENEELKQRNNRQAKQLDRLYNLIEEKDWRTLTDIIDDFKRCEEQLQKEWGTYGDVE